jgi:hypothetical protein
MVKKGENSLNFMLLKALKKWSKTSPFLLYNPYASGGFAPWIPMSDLNPLAETACAYTSPLFWLQPWYALQKRLPSAKFYTETIHFYMRHNICVNCFFFVVECFPILSPINMFSIDLTQLATYIHESTKDNSMLVGFTTTYAIRAYRHLRCEL